MSLSFPNSPSTNDTHTTGGSSWIFDGEKWVRQGTTGPQGIQGLQGVQGLQGLSIQGVQGLQGLMGIQGRQGVQGTDGADGNFGGATFDYTFDTSTSNGDPGTGKLRLNNSTVSSATALYIDVEDDNGTDISSFLTTIDDSTSTIKGHFRISNRLNADDFALFTISSASSQQGAYYSVSCGYVSGSASSFSNSEDVIITFARTGDKGDTGATGSQGVQGLQGLKGSQGVQGLSNQGVQGLQGILGTAGSAGAAGAQGTTGTAGSNGSNGAQGTAGTAAGGGVGVDYDDNIKVRFGDDEDIEQFFDGTRFKIHPKTTTTTSQLDFEVKDQVYIHSIDNGIFLRSKNQEVINIYGGSGGGVYFHHNGNDKLKLEGGNWTTQGDADWTFSGTDYNIVFDASDSALEFADNAIAKFGTGDDLQIYHDGSNSIIRENGIGALTIQSNGGEIAVFDFANSQNMGRFITAGAVELFHNGTKKFETVTGGISVTGNITCTQHIDLGDSQELRLGASDDFKIYHDGTTSFIKDVGTGNLNVDTNGSAIVFTKNESEDLAKFIADGAVELYHNGNKKFETGQFGATVTGSLAASNIELEDNGKLLIGTGDDLQIFHDGSSSYIINSTGELQISSGGSALFLQAVTNENAIKVIPNNAVELYYDGTKRFETTSDGAKITGIATAATLYTSNGTFNAGNDTVTDAAIVIPEEGVIYTEDGTYLRTLIEKKSDTINIGQQNTALINGIELKPGNSSTNGVKLHFGGTSDNVKLQTTSNGVKITGGLQDKDGQLGSSGQVLSSTGTQLNWVDADSGPQGVQGTKGTTGNTGSTGSTGATGSQGVQGLKGTTGNTGSTGSTGSTGAQGIAGSDGTNGSNGSNGAQGTAGSAGSNGSNGSNGAQGTAGTQGAIGPDGGNAGTLDNLDSSQFLRSDANDSTSGTVDFLGGTSTTPAVRVRSGGNSWSEGLAIHPSSDNGYALTFFRTTSSLTTNTNTWAIGNSGESSVNSFTLLRRGLTGSAAQRADAVFDVTQAGTFRFGFTPTVGSNTIWHAGNDGSGSGLDADTLDGFQTHSANNNWGVIPTVKGDGVMEVGKYIDFHTADNDSGDDFTPRLEAISDTELRLGGNKIWHAGNDGASSGLDADLLDGSHGADYLDYNNFTNTPTIPTNNNQLTNGAGYITSFDITTQTDSKYLRSDTADTATGTITFNSGADIVINGNMGANGTTALASMTGRLRFDNDYSDTARGPNKIQLYNDGNTWMAGLGVHSDTASYYSGAHHRWYRSTSQTAFTQVLALDSSGNLSATGTVTASSDVSLKDNITTIPNALDKVLEMRGVEYDRNDLDGKHQIGVIAQEIEKVIPELVFQDEDTGLKSVSYGNITAVLIEAIKELKKENDALSARIQSLEDR